MPSTILLQEFSPDDPVYQAYSTTVFNTIVDEAEKLLAAPNPPSRTWATVAMVVVALETVAFMSARLDFPLDQLKHLLAVIYHAKRQQLEAERATN